MGNRSVTGRVGGKGFSTKGSVKKFLWSDGKVLYPHCSDGYTLSMHTVKFHRTINTGEI